MQHSIMNTLTPDLTHKILNDPSLQSKQDVQNISAVCKAFRAVKDVPTWRITHNVPLNIFQSAENRSCSVLDLSSCDLDGITVPASLPSSLKRLNLGRGTTIPSQLINLALSSSTIEKLGLGGCDLEGCFFPVSPPASLKKLYLSSVTNIPPQLIDLSLRSSTIETLHLGGRDLEGISVPDTLPDSLKGLHLFGAKNIPADLITKASGCPHCNVTGYNS